ncbi:hypothetical protein OIDMADRAFT_45954 [Oidiodendron maius Zn]|uniref:Flavodoxin-like domain-containing protein n=1 Tax=Oidiodendron maius (strain Zn) TaxID=913774 RepID=A0A0C3GR43_OIDMZ|nr:hypothetical protein OIDMADRAFT_45954 [Oidiodendron maius Zn]
MVPKVAIVFYSLYGHIKSLAEAEKQGLKKAGIEADIYQVAETLPQEVLTMMHAPPKSDYPVVGARIMEKYDAFLFGIPTRTVIASLSTLTHHGLIYVPLGYAKSFAQLSNVSEVHGGSPWGAGTFAGGDGSRSPSALELELATIQGESFGNTISKVETRGTSKNVNDKAADSGHSGFESADKEGLCGLPSKCVVS